MTYYPSVADVECIIGRPEFFGTDSHVMNGGLLEAALERPKAAFYGVEQHPELHQKAAALMEALCKSHALSDGNKRIALAAAEFMVRMSGRRLILPLKSVRLAADAAMDEGGRMSEEIRAWFKIRVAANPVQLRIMLDEIIGESRAVEALRNGGDAAAEEALDQWLAFDLHPGPERIDGKLAGLPGAATPLPPRLEQYDRAEYSGHSLQESEEHCARIRRLEASFDRGSADRLWESVRVFDAFGFAHEALEFLEAVRALGDETGARRYRDAILHGAGVPGARI